MGTNLLSAIIYYKDLTLSELKQHKAYYTGEWLEVPDKISTEIK